MRDALCFILALTLLFALMLTAARPAQPAGRQAAWWGLLYPGFWGGESECVTFSWPLFNRVLHILGCC